MVAPMAPKGYDPKSVVIAVAGIPLPGGFAEDSMVKITFDNPKFDDVVGVDGQVTRVRSHDGRALVTVTLMQSSDTNDILSTLVQRDLAVPNGAGVGAFIVKDLLGRTLITASACWVKGFPETEFGKKPGPRAWEIRLADAEQFVGGALSIGA